MCELLIGADDRTGALESAGAAAVAIGGPVTLMVGVPSAPGVSGPVVTGPVVAVDLGTRHLSSTNARERAAALDRIPSRRHLHKIDSTLRGRWADELIARSSGGARPVLLVPALPALGRVCVDGVVLADGRPVGDGAAGVDVIAPPASSRPDELLVLAGAVEIHSIRQLGQLAGWLDAPSGIAVADASSDEQVAALVARWWGHDDVLLAGSSAVVLAAARLVAVGAGERRRGGDPARPSAPPGRILVIVGSAHPVVTEQLTRLEQRGVRRVSPDDPVGPDAPSEAPTVISARSRPSGQVAAAVAEQHARALAAAAARWTELLDPDVIVVIGGDTAAAVLGDSAVEVEGLIGPGTPWARQPTTGRVIVSRAGGFGGPDALVDLVWGTLVR